MTPRWIATLCCSMALVSTVTAAQSPAGDSRTVHDAWESDVNGQARLVFQKIEEHTSITPDIQETYTRLLMPGTGTALEEMERTERLEHRVSPGIVRFDSRHLVRDLNGRWQLAEARRGEMREIGSSERVKDETVQIWEADGTPISHERFLTWWFTATDREQLIIEIYSGDDEGFVRVDAGPERLSRRISRSTTVTADGGRQTVEEIEARNPVAMSEPLRLVQRTVTTVSPDGPERTLVLREVFELDLNGRLVLVRSEREEMIE